MKNKLSMILLVILMAAILLAGCNPQTTTTTATTGGNEGTTTTSSTTESVATTTSSSGNTTGALKVWMPPFGTEDTLDKVFWEGQINEWATPKGIKTTVEITPWGNYEEKYLTGITSGQGPDVGYMYLEMIADYINMEALIAFDEYLTPADRDNYLYLANGVVQGKQYMLPIVVGNPRIFVCNMDILAKSGFTEVPKTWEDLVTYGKKILVDSPEVAPFAQGWAQPSVGALNVLFYPYLWQAGGSLVSEDNKWIFNSEAGIKAVTFAQSLMYDSKIMPENCTAYEDSDITNMFLEGKIAMTIVGASEAKQLDDAGINWDFAASLTDVTGGTFVASDALVMINTAKDQALAFECMRYMTSGPVMTAFHKELSPFPPIGKDEPYGDNPKFEEMYATSSSIFHSLPAVAGSSKVFDALYKNLQLVMLNEMSPKEALDEAIKYADSLD